jgi:hypothetical protein
MESWIIAVVLTVLIVLAQRLAILEIRRAARRLRAIEANINQRAGETLLSWETDHGAGGDPFFFTTRLVLDRFRGRRFR